MVHSRHDAGEESVLILIQLLLKHEVPVSILILLPFANLLGSAFLGTLFSHSLCEPDIWNSISCGFFGTVYLRRSPKTIKVIVQKNLNFKLENQEERRGSFKCIQYWGCFKYFELKELVLNSVILVAYTARFVENLSLDR